MKGSCSVLKTSYLSNNNSTPRGNIFPYSHVDASLFSNAPATRRHFSGVDIFGRARQREDVESGSGPEVGPSLGALQSQAFMPICQSSRRIKIHATHEASSIQSIRARLQGIMTWAIRLTESETTIANDQSPVSPSEHILVPEVWAGKRQQDRSHVNDQTSSILH